MRREAFEHPRGLEAITGKLTRAEWADQVGEAVGSVDAARTWLHTWGAADREMAQLVLDVRAAGTPVAVLTNGTTSIHDELEFVGLADHFDRVFCSSFIGITKPDAAVYLHVCEQMGVEPARVMFTDDSAGNVEGARTAGLQAHLFESPSATRAILQSHVPGLASPE